VAHAGERLCVEARDEPATHKAYSQTAHGGEILQFSLDSCLQMSRKGQGHAKIIRRRQTVTMRRWTIGITAVIGLLGAFAQPPISEPLFDSAWPTWGRDMRRSHFVDDLAGPNTPAVLWFRLGGALEEPAIPGNSLWVPQHPAQGSRYTRYTFYNPVNGRATGSFGPFWGQPSTPIFLNAAVFIVDNNGNSGAPARAVGRADAVRWAV
jgi:hypothetical protein